MALHLAVIPPRTSKEKALDPERLLVPPSTFHVLSVLEQCRILETHVPGVSDGTMVDNKGDTYDAWWDRFFTS